jgi:transposase InsO family protein
MEDSSLKEVVTLLESFGSDIPWSSVISSDQHVKNYWSQRDRLKVINGSLYRMWTSVDGLVQRWVLIVPHGLRVQLMRLAHTGSTGGHLGIRRTQKQVQRRAYWSGWAGDVARFCRQCEECARYHRGAPCRQGELQPTLVGEPLERMAVDLCGPFPKSRSGYVYILTIVDMFTKWAEAVPLRNKEAVTVARALVNEVFHRVGIPVQLLSDRGMEFESHLTHELCRILGIDKIRTTAYKPSSNGGIERLHRTLNSMMGKVVAENQRDWDERLPSIMAAYRASPHESTGYSPNFLMFGREVRAPVDLLYDAPSEERELWSSPDAFVEHRLELMRKSYALVREHLGKSAERMKQHYDMRVRPKVFEVGQWVWMYYPRRYVGKTPKWQRLYTGPFLIIKMMGAVNAVIQKSRRAAPIVVHIDKLKPVLGSTPQSWLGIAENTELPEPEFPLNLPLPVEIEPPQSVSDGDEMADDERRPRRHVGRPKKLDDFVCNVISDADLVRD